MEFSTYLTLGQLAILLDNPDAELVVVRVRQCVLDFVLVGANQSFKGVSHDHERDRTVDGLAELQ